MKIRFPIYLLAFVPLLLTAQEGSSTSATDEVTVINETGVPSAEAGNNQPATVVEIPDAEIEGASFDLAGEKIPVAEEGRLDEDEVVLEMPGLDSASSGGSTRESDEGVTVNYRDEDVRTILRSVADLYELNLVIPDTLQGRTSLKLRNVSWQSIFDLVLEPLGFTYVEDKSDIAGKNKIIQVKSLAEIETEPVDTIVEVINHAKAGEIEASIAPLVDNAAGGRIQVDTRSNALVITERPSRMKRIKEIIARLDQPTDQVMIETKFIEVTEGDVKDIGVNWASLEDYQLGAGPFNRQWTRSRESGTNSSSSNGTSTESNTDTTSGSINGNTSAVPRTVTTEENVNSTFEALTNLTSAGSTGRFDTAVFDAAQFRLVLSALQQVNDSKLVANPTVVTMNNQLAKIDIVREVPQVEFTFNQETGTREAQGLADPLSFGTSIEVTPQIVEGSVKLKVVPEVSNQVGIRETQLGPQPIIDRRVAETNVVIKDGFTLAIGGLSQNEETKSGTRVPLLGSLPGVGKLFRSDSDDITQRNLIIFITAKVLNPDGTDYREVVDPRTLDEMAITPSELPGYQVSEEERKLLDQLETIRSKASEAERAAKLRARIEAQTTAGEVSGSDTK